MADRQEGWFERSPARSVYARWPGPEKERGAARRRRLRCRRAFGRRPRRSVCRRARRSRQYCLGCAPVRQRRAVTQLARHPSVCAMGESLPWPNHPAAAPPAVVRQRQVSYLPPGNEPRARGLRPLPPGARHGERRAPRMVAVRVCQRDPVGSVGRARQRRRGSPGRCR